MNCGYCRDCKHWEDAPEQGISETHRRCTLIEPWEGDSMDQHLAFGGGYDFSGSLHTAPDFGCVQFEAKP